LGKYFGVIDEKDADIWVQSEELPFYLEVDEDGRLWAVPKDIDKPKKSKPSN
jgi:hypothetical protein|tara:strand:- start:2397 stop:2552 length:156 start_codon:yes stop_codon:yes gene_type:complete